MFDLLRMDLRRLARDKATYIILATFCAIMVLVCGMMALEANDALMEGAYSLGGGASLTITEHTEMIQDAAEAQQLLAGSSRANFFYTTFCSGGGLSVFIIILSTLFVCADFSSGFAKNIFSLRQRKAPYILSKSLTLLCALTGFLLVGGVLLEVLFRVFRLPLAPSPLSEYAAYFLQAWLTTAAFTVQNVFFSVWLRNAAGSMILSFVCAGGVLGILLDFLGGLLGLKLAPFTLAGAVSGMGLSAFSAVVCVVWLGIYLLLGAVTLRRKDI